MADAAITAGYAQKRGGVPRPRPGPVRALRPGRLRRAHRPRRDGGRHAWTARALRRSSPRHRSARCTRALHARARHLPGGALRHQPWRAMRTPSATRAPSAMGTPLTREKTTTRRAGSWSPSTSTTAARRTTALPPSWSPRPSARATCAKTPVPDRGRSPGPRPELRLEHGLPAALARRQMFYDTSARPSGNAPACGPPTSTWRSSTRTSPARC